MAGEKRDKDRKVKRELRAFDGSLGPEVKHEVLRIGKAPKEKDRHYIEFPGGCAPLSEEISYTLTFVRRCVCLVCLCRCDWGGGGGASFGTLPSLSKVDKNNITGQSVRSTRLADQEK